MRVLHISPSFARAEGDPHSPWTVELMRRLMARGIATAMLVPAFKGLRDHQVYGLQVYRFRYAPASLETLTHESGAPNRLQKNPFLYLLIPAYLIGGLVRLFTLGQPRYDVIHVHWPLPQIIFGIAYKWVTGARLVATSYGADMRMAKRMWLVRIVLRWLMRRADALVATSPIVAREVTEVTGIAPRIIEYWVTLPRDVVPPTPHSPFQLLAVGRLIERKGYDYLLRALALMENDLDVRLTLVGDGQERANLESLARELGIESRVQMLNRVSDAELARLYATCDAFVHSSIVDRTGDTESVGMVLLEAMSYARPIVATNVGGIPDVIKHNETGILVEEKNPRAFADAILSLARDPGLMQRLGAAARASVQAQVNWDKSVDELVQIYEGKV
jgi:glycosyltransferase involved in cell wall biosynthesis